MGMHRMRNFLKNKVKVEVKRVVLKYNYELSALSNLLKVHLPLA